MALLDSSTDGAGPSDDAAKAAITAGREGTDPPADELPPEPEPPKSVSVAPKPRRAKIEEEYAKKLEEVSNNLLRMQEGLSARDRQIGELTGHIAALSQRPAYAPPQYQPAPQPQIPDPQELRRKALERLDAKDMDGYHRHLEEAHTAATLRQLQPILAQRMQQAVPQQQADQMPPALMPYFAAYPDVAAHPKAMQLLASKNVELDARGVPAGPERVKQIFEEVRGILGAGRPTGQAQAYSSQAASVLSGVPTARPSNGSAQRGGEPRVELTAEERFIAKKTGMDEGKYAQLVAKNHPERILR